MLKIAFANVILYSYENHTSYNYLHKRMINASYTERMSYGMTWRGR